MVQAAQQAGEEAKKDQAKVAGAVELLSGKSRRDRQQAAQIVAAAAKSDVSLVLPYANELVDALNRPEAQTRWEVLDALTALVDVDSRACDKAVPGAETALFDEDSGPLRLAAMRFLCKIGSTTENRSEKVWPLVDEAIQCCHGDLEFQDMLIAVNDFACGKLSDEVRSSLAARMEFDAANGKGALKRRAAQIVENALKSK